jgi:hypothetical protein
MPEEPRSDGVASVSGGVAAELAAAGFEERHAEVVATVGNTVYCIGGANRPTQRPRRDGRCARFQVRVDRENFSLRALLEPLEPVLV